MTASILIGIPTFRRPLGLEKLLLSLNTQDINDRFCVLVVDNDFAEHQGKDVCERLISEGALNYRLDCITIETRGIAEARNAVLHEIRIGYQTIKWLAMLDDDEWPTPNWLSQLSTTNERFSADVTGGPVERIFPEGTPDSIVALNAFKSKSLHSRTIKCIESTANFLMSVAFIRSSELSFDVSFSMSGGSDRDFFMRCKKAGARFAWASSARVYEDFPQTRCTSSWALQRAYRVGNTEMLAYLKNKPAGFVFKEIVKMCLTLAIYIASRMPRESELTRLRGQIALTRLHGKIDALRGKRTYEYTITHGT
jgi:succinoglycan biosynthesis protein ExoM